jgi:shikimate dehydrogenase
MPKLAVLGQPVAHSRSPAMQTAALAALGLASDWTYEAIEVSADDFAGLVGRLPGEGFVGVNVTVPHKLAALELADHASDSARAIGAANTLTFTDGGVEAENTDARGLLDALDGPLRGRHALVLGAGGSARAAIWALREAGADVSVWRIWRVRSTFGSPVRSLGSTS